VTGHLDLWVPGWDIGPCDTATPSPPTQPPHEPPRQLEPRAVETRFGHGLDHPDGRPRIIPGDHGQPPGRRRDLEPRRIHNIRVKGGLL
jgi:hypothetical protein